MAPLRYAAKFDPFLSLDCSPKPFALSQSKERMGSNFAIWQPCYQTISQRKENYSSVNRLLWRKRHCALCCADSRNCSEKNHKKQQQQQRALAAANKKITLSANIEPFPPFTIRHDVESGRASIDGDGGAALQATVVARWL